ncbi:site-2 protease family protein [Candidatus Atelocyanobacterium thalassae]|uniref:Predicted membrane-associated Zn-dependent protease n=1 Tax=Atelocyanobacterium thalassa (isolate ALOHA) TaxID=1453429 RepID=D3ER25_ATETH|nr:site-2 protease family protein [Candidatus Atelocyanobacterium thalassa]ADB95925.1 predicted membrane-associated Zn-dependent protease [Candidatus Atelocyanobacterium thalassa isolate ALOHA]MCH2543944.1 site-2 protease family protein [Candidatus Atelocyanobacterium sp. ALOHA_A2.5_9]|tara:strand:+ start:19459 stop:20913 length:1455 start_codon:yes stop_codon:yes gene_type:complete
MLTLSEKALIFFSLTITIGIFFLINNQTNFSKGIKFFSRLRLISLISPWIIIFAFLFFEIELSLINIFLILLPSSLSYIYISQLIKRKQEEKLKEDDLLQVKLDSNKNANGSLIISQDLLIMKNIFSIDTFFSTESIPYEEGIIFRGNLRGDPDATYKLLSSKLRTHFDEKYCLFLVEGNEGKPVVIVLPNTNNHKAMTTLQKNLAIVLFLATVVTSLEKTSILLGFDLFDNWNRFHEVIPITLALWIIIAFHEIGHLLVASFYNIKLSWPFFLPIWEIGSFGAITRFESLIPNRKTLFDISFAGPAFSGIISIVLLVCGLIFSHPGSLLQMTTQSFQKSILISVLAKFILGDQLKNSIIDINPLFIIGWLGLIITALNLMPAGQLDGGRILQSIYGRETVRKSTIITLIILGIVTILNPTNPIPLYWIMFILFLQRDTEKPSLNELTEPNNIRAILALISISIMLLILMPLNSLLVESLGMGG